MTGMTANGHLKQVLICALCVATGFIAGIFKGTTPISIEPISVLQPRLRPPFTHGTTFSKEVPTRVLHNALKKLSTAHRHAHSAISILEIQQTFHMLHSLLEETSTSRQNATTLATNRHISPVYSPETVTDRDVCPEVWMGMEYGYPYYEHGHELGNCSYGKAMKNILTIVVDFTENPHDAEKVITLIHSQYKQVEIIAIQPERMSIPGVSSVIQTDSPHGEDFNRAIAKVNTKYTLVAKGFYHFDESAQLERLVRMVNYLGVDVAAGSHRNLSGYWKIDCFQVKMLNYGFRVVEGYDLSYNSCIYCDYAAGPFLAKTEFLQNHKFPESDLKGELLLLNYFYELKQKRKIILNCPDSMFFTQHISHLNLIPRYDWLGFAKHHLLNTINLPGISHSFNCDDLNYKCSNIAPKGSSNMPCCVRVIPDMLKYLFDNAERHGIEMEVEAGTNVGAVKFYGTLPWEVDADLEYKALPTGQAKLRRLIRQFRKDGYDLSEDKKARNCPSVNDSYNVNCGYFAYRKHPFRIELWGAVRIANDSLSKWGLTGTKVLIDGHWFPGYPNPVRFARNLYGDDVFEHVEHWSVIGYSTGWKEYNTGSWRPCTEPGKHYCLNNFLPVGNIQFQEIWI